MCLTMLRERNRTLAQFAEDTPGYGLEVVQSVRGTQGGYLC